MASFARAFVTAFSRTFAGVLGRAGGEYLGPNQAGTVGDGTWTLSLNGGLAGTVTQDANGLHFAGANNIAAASHPLSPASVDNATYQIDYTVANMTAAGVRPILYGPTTGHGGTGTTRNANGTYSERVTCSGAGSFTNQIRFQATGASGQNTFDITFCTVRRVLTA